ncbi:unnamed protein product [Lasius platythorax]|uniref:Uncharacterized protein n=1 Tax=Lasius platythorax TaxID=488582 RepID=A0AAV2N0P0_9HYME
MGTVLVYLIGPRNLPRAGYDSSGFLECSGSCFGWYSGLDCVDLFVVGDLDDLDDLDVLGDLEVLVEFSRELVRSVSLSSSTSTVLSTDPVLGFIPSCLVFCSRERFSAVALLTAVAAITKGIWCSKRGAVTTYIIGGGPKKDRLSVT